MEKRTEYQIRNYEEADDQAVIGLIRGNTPRFFHPSEERELLQYLREGREEYFVIEKGQEVVGAGGLNYFLAEKSARISWDMVHPAHQGQGVGGMLLAYRLGLARQHPLVSHVVVWTSQMAYPFYAKFGFELKKVEKDFWATGFDLYLMALQFPSNRFSLV